MSRERERGEWVRLVGATRSVVSFATPVSIETISHELPQVYFAVQIGVDAIEELVQLSCSEVLSQDGTKRLLELRRAVISGTS